MKVITNNIFRLSVRKTLSRIICIKLAQQKLARQNYFHWNKIQRIWELFATTLKHHKPYWAIVWRKFHRLVFALEKLNELRRSLTKGIIPRLGMTALSTGEVGA